MAIFNNMGTTDELINGIILETLKLKSLFVAGTDTDVGKTYITAGLAVALRKMNVDIGVMKPFAAGTAQKKGYKSEDVEILANAAQTCDPESLVNPQFFPIPASPYTAWKNLKTKPKISTILSPSLAPDYEQSFNSNYLISIFFEEYKDAITNKKCMIISLSMLDASTGDNFISF